MTLNTNIEHPHFVSIPDPQCTEGLRAYREPAEPHPLQVTFLDADAEKAWVCQMRESLGAGCVEVAEARLSAELACFDGKLARLCKEISSDDVVLEGWNDLLPILSEWEGPPISAITIGITNPPDLVFDAGAQPDPELLIGLYSDEGFPFSRASKADLLAECDKELPAWVGAEEDVEFYCKISGLAELNAALINCKHRHFLRDGRDGVEGRAPGGYVEYVLASWFLAMRFLQAVARAVSEHGAPEGARVIAGTVDMNADFVTVLGADRPSTLAAPRAAAEPSFAALTVKPWTPRDDMEDGGEQALSLRQRLRSRECAAVPEPSRGFFSRLFGRLRRR